MHVLSAFIERELEGEGVSVLSKVMELVNGSPRLVSRKSAAPTWLSTLFHTMSLVRPDSANLKHFLALLGASRWNHEPGDLGSIPALPWETSSHLRM